MIHSSVLPSLWYHIHLVRSWLKRMYCLCKYASHLVVSELLKIIMSSAMNEDASLFSPLTSETVTDIYRHSCNSFSSNWYHKRFWCLWMFYWFLLSFLFLLARAKCLLMIHLLAWLYRTSLQGPWPRGIFWEMTLCSFLMSGMCKYPSPSITL